MFCCQWVTIMWNNNSTHDIHACTYLGSSFQSHSPMPDNLKPTRLVERFPIATCTHFTQQGNMYKRVMITTLGVWDLT